MWSDGSCPKPDGPGGYAAILQAFKGQTDEVIKEAVAQGGAKATTNNKMELTAVLAGLELLVRPTTLTIVLDSQYVMHGFTEGWIEKWKRNGWRTGSAMVPRYATANLLEAEAEDPKAVKNRDLWERLDSLVARHQITWRHVKGHLKDTQAGWTWWHANNVRADELAGAQTKLMQQALTEPAGSHR